MQSNYYIVDGFCVALHMLRGELMWPDRHLKGASICIRLILVSFFFFVCVLISFLSNL